MRRITRLVVSKYLLYIQRETRIFLQKKRACSLIQKKWRRTNNIDPISLRRIVLPVLIFRHNIPMLYDATTLREYIFLTGDLRDPICRTQLSAEELVRIDSVLPVKPLLISMFTSFKDLRERFVLNLSLSDALEREMFRYIFELGELTEHEAFEKLYDESASILYQCFLNYKSIDRDRCRISLKTILAALNHHIPCKTHPRLNVYIRNIVFTFQSDLTY